MKTFNQAIILFLLFCFSLNVLGVDYSSEVVQVLDSLVDDESILHTNQQKHNLLHLAVITEDMDTIQYLSDKAPSLVKGRDEDGDTPFLYSCMVGNMEIADFLLSKDGVDIDESNNNKETCLHFLAFRLHLDHIRTMRAKGADPSIPDVDGDLPAHILLMRLQLAGILSGSVIDPDDIEAALESLSI